MLKHWGFVKAEPMAKILYAEPNLLMCSFATERCKCHNKDKKIRKVSL